MPVPRRLWAQQCDMCVAASFRVCRSGRPQVVVPAGFDQPLWGERLHYLGVAPPPIPGHRLSAAAVAAAVRQAHATSVALAAKRLQAAIAAHDASTGGGLGVAAHLIADFATQFAA